MKENKSEPRSISFPADVWELIENTANETGISRSSLLLIAYNNFFQVKKNKQGRLYYEKSPKNQILQVTRNK